MGELLPFPSPPAWEPWVDEKTLANHLGVSSRSLRRYRSEGMPSRKLAGHRRYQISKVESWFEQRSQGGAA